MRWEQKLELQKFKQIFIQITPEKCSQWQIFAWTRWSYISAKEYGKVPPENRMMLVARWVPSRAVGSQVPSTACSREVQEAPPSHSGLHHLSHHNNRNQTLAFKLRIWLWFHLWGCRYDVKMSWNVCTGRLYLESSLGGRTKYHFCGNQWEFWMAVPLCGHPAPNGELLGRVKVSWCGLLCSPGEWSSFYDFKTWPKNVLTGPSSPSLIVFFRGKNEWKSFVGTDVSVGSDRCRC